MSEPMDKQQIETMLDLHHKWLYDEPGGERANLRAQTCGAHLTQVWPSPRLACVLKKAHSLASRMPITVILVSLASSSWRFLLTPSAATHLNANAEPLRLAW